MARPTKSKNYKNPPHRPPTFVGPDDLWNTFLKYIEDVKNNPIMKPELAKYKDYTEVVYLPLIVPLTKEDFAEFCELSHWKVIKEYENKGPDFLNIITRIENIIYANKFKGASAGIFNPNIIARELGLSEKQSIDVNAIQKKNTLELFPPLEDEATDK